MTKKKQGRQPAFVWHFSFLFYNATRAPGLDWTGLATTRRGPVHKCEKGRNAFCRPCTTLDRWADEAQSSSPFLSTLPDGVHDVPYVYVILKFTLSVDGLPFSLSPPHAVATLQRHGGGGKPTHQISPHFRLSHSDSRHSPYYHDIGTGTIALALALRFPSQLHGLKT